MGFSPETQIGTLIDFSRGGGWGKEAPFEGSTRVAVVRGADFPDVEAGRYTSLPFRYEKEAKARNVALRAGDIVLENSGGTDTRPTGRTVLISQELLDVYDCPVIPASFCRIVRFNASVDSEFIYYWLQNMFNAGRTWGYQNRSTGLSNFQFRTFAEMELVPDLSLETQRQIGRILAMLDKKRLNNNRLNGYLLEMATAQFERELADEKFEFRLSELVELEDSKRVPLNSRDRENRKGPYPYYGVTSVMDYVDDYLFDGIRVLLGEDGTVIREDGRPVLQYVWGKYWVNNHAHVLKAKMDYSLEAIYIALARTAINHIVTGAVQMKISQKNLNGLELELPSRESLDYLKDVFSLYRNNVEESKRLECLRDTLLPKLMSGEIDVSKIDLTQLNK